MPFNRYCLIGLRIDRKITINHIAWETFIDASVLHRIETGRTKNPSYATVQNLADYFKVNVETFRGA